MKITSARVIVCCPGRNFVTLKIETDEGLTEPLAARYPYQRAYLPVNRLAHDATLWNW